MSPRLEVMINDVSDLLYDVFRNNKERIVEWQKVGIKSWDAESAFSIFCSRLNNHHNVPLLELIPLRSWPVVVMLFSVFRGDRNDWRLRIVGYEIAVNKAIETAHHAAAYSCPELSTIFMGCNEWRRESVDSYLPESRRQSSAILAVLAHEVGHILARRAAACISGNHEDLSVCDEFQSVVKSDIAKLLDVGAFGMRLDRDGVMHISCSNFEDFDRVAMYNKVYLPSPKDFESGAAISKLRELCAEGLAYAIGCGSHSPLFIQMKNVVGFANKVFGLVGR